MVASLDPGPTKPTIGFKLVLAPHVDGDEFGGDDNARELELPPATVCCEDLVIGAKVKSADEDEDDEDDVDDVAEEVVAGAIVGSEVSDGAFACACWLAMASLMKSMLFSRAIGEYQQVSRISQPSVMFGKRSGSLEETGTKVEHVRKHIGE